MTDISIIFEDDSICVINKPSGIVVNEAESSRGNTIQSWFEAKNPGIQEYRNLEFGQKGGVVHRLDKDTSGVMVLAKTPEAYTVLKQQFLERKTVKKYVALVHGKFKENDGVITAPLMRHPKNRFKFTVGGDVDRSAITEWKVIGQYSMHNAEFTLLELTPHTGRTHQLRVHLQSINHPIVSDPIYGFAKRIQDDLSWCPRLFLHAKYLEFIHPVSGEKVHFESDLPLELSACILE